MQAVLATKIRRESTEQAGAACDKSRKDDKREAGSCMFPQEKSSAVYHYTVALLWNKSVSGH